MSNNGKIREQIITGVVRMDYVYLTKMNKQDKYSATIIIPKSDTKTLGKIREAFDSVCKQMLSEGTIKKVTDVKFPLRDGDEERADNEAYKDTYFVDLKSNFEVQAVDKDNKKIDISKIFSGCLARVQMSIYEYEYMKKVGVSCGLGHIQLIDDRDDLVLFKPNTVENTFSTFESDEDLPF